MLRLCDMRGKTGAGKGGGASARLSKRYWQIKKLPTAGESCEPGSAVVAVCSIIDFETQSLRIVGRHYNL